MDKEEILKIKEEMEAASKSFVDHAKALNEAGFKVASQIDGSVYIWKDVREDYGVQVQAPAMNKEQLKQMSEGSQTKSAVQ